MLYYILYTIIFHGHKILENCIEPLRLLSKETLYSRNKDVKIWNEIIPEFSRNQNIDVFIFGIIRSFYKDSKINEYPEV